MAEENKTRPTALSAQDFIAALESPKRRVDAQASLKLYEDATGYPPVMWGPSIIGFGKRHYRYETGREGDVPLACFSPRKPHMTYYLHSKFEDGADLYARLGKYKKSGGCVHINKLEDIDLAVLREIVARSFAHMKEKGLDLS
ncbi:MAG: DUF1801 domain-containing protein [Alphaproteobacteria bacterium]